ncbi:MAG: ParA family protein [Deltaproteobacteria bacterium]|nr:MAG: ParA family protein [Deltaproteobacteria bacterium]
MRAKCIAFAHHKGGTGKTTSCVNIAGGLAKIGKKVLVVDLDPQASATVGLGINRNYLSVSLYDALFDRCNNEGKICIEDVIISTEIDNIHLAPADLDLAGILVSMHNTEDAPMILDQILNEVKDNYDYILIDTPPSYSFFLINGIVAADHIVLPIDTGYFSTESIETFATILKDVEDELGVKKEIDTVIVTKFQESKLQSIYQKISQTLRLPKFISFEDPIGEIKDKIKIYLSVRVSFNGNIFIVPYSREVYEAQKKGLPISHYTPDSRIGKIYWEITKKMVDGISI